MQLSMTTDYVTSAGDPAPSLRRIAEAGFTHVHWCHEWNTDVLYSEDDINRIGECLKGCHLQLLDLHASAGARKNWAGPAEDVRAAGEELVRNRMAMAAQLGSDVIILHIPGKPAAPEDLKRFAGQLHRSLDALTAFGRQCRVKIAIENMANDDFSGLRALFSEYGPESLGLCYDSGHGNIGGQGLNHLDSVKDRLLSVHLHDNDGAGDQHKLPFTGTVDWPRLARIMAAFSYMKCVSSESTMGNTGITDEKVFLRQAVAAEDKFSLMIEVCRDSRSR